MKLGLCTRPLQVANTVTVQAAPRCVKNKVYAGTYCAFCILPKIQALTIDLSSVEIRLYVLVLPSSCSRVLI